MRLLTVLCTICFVVSCSTGPNSQNNNESANREVSSNISRHQTVFGHSHKHGSNCGHDSETAGTNTVYIHNGEKHLPHAGHVDLIN